MEMAPPGSILSANLHFILKGLSGQTDGQRKEVRDVLMFFYRDGVKPPLSVVPNRFTLQKVRYDAKDGPLLFVMS